MWLLLGLLESCLNLFLFIKPFIRGLIHSSIHFLSLLVPWMTMGGSGAQLGQGRLWTSCGNHLLWEQVQLLSWQGHSWQRVISTGSVKDRHHVVTELTGRKSKETQSQNTTCKVIKNGPLVCVCECMCACLHCMTWSVWRRRASCRCRPVCPWPPKPWWKSCMCAGRCWGSQWRGSAGQLTSQAAAQRWHSGSAGPCRSWASCWSKCQHHLYGDVHRIWWIYTYTHTHTHKRVWAIAGLQSKEEVTKVAEQKQPSKRESK